jgi:hypothetical protein
VAARDAATGAVMDEVSPDLVPEEPTVIRSWDELRSSGLL